MIDQNLRVFEPVPNSGNRAGKKCAKCCDSLFTVLDKGRADCYHGTLGCYVLGFLNMFFDRKTADFVNEKARKIRKLGPLFGIFSGGFLIG